jgi:hypothetical protein
VVEGTQSSPILVSQDKVAAPASLEEASALSLYRSRIELLVHEYKPSLVAIRTSEPFAQGAGRDGPKRRSRIEGVLLQTIDSCGLKVTLGALATISSKLGSRAKKYLTTGQLRGLDLTAIPDLAREAVLVAVAALPEE